MLMVLLSSFVHHYNPTFVRPGVLLSWFASLAPVSCKRCPAEHDAVGTTSSMILSGRQTDAPVGSSRARNSLHYGNCRYHCTREMVPTHRSAAKSALAQSPSDEDLGSQGQHRDSRSATREHRRPGVPYSYAPWQASPGRTLPKSKNQGHLCEELERTAIGSKSRSTSMRGSPLIESDHTYTGDAHEKDLTLKGEHKHDRPLRPQLERTPPDIPSEQGDSGEKRKIKIVPQMTGRARRQRIRRKRERATRARRKSLVKKVAALGKLGLWQEAISEVDSAIRSGLSPDSYVYGSCIGAVAHSGRWREALNLLRRMRGEGIAPTTPVFNAAIKACSRGGQLKAVFALLDEMCAGEGPVPAVALTTTPHARTSCGEVSPRRQVHHSSDPDIQTFNTVMSACGRAGEWELALEVMRQAKEQRGLRPTRVTYNAAIAACGKGGRVERAVELLGEMRDAGLVPDAMSFNSAILACAERGSWKQALSLLREMESSSQIGAKGGGPKGLRAEGISPDEFSYSSAIVACGRGGKWSLGVGLLDSMRRKGVSPSTVSYNAAMTACGDAGQWQRAVELLREMQAAQRIEGSEQTTQVEGSVQVPTVSAPAPDAISYNVAIRACSNAGQWQPAISLLEEMRQQSHAKKEPTEAENASAASRVHVSDPLDVALSGSSGKSDRSSPPLVPSPDVVSYSTAVAACARAGKWRRTLALLELMRREGPAPNSATFSGAIAACVRRLGRVGESCYELPPSLLLAELIEHMRLSIVPPSAPCYARALEACAEAGLCEESRSLVEEMVAAEVRIDQSVLEAVAKTCRGAALYRNGASVTALSRPEG